MSLKKCSKCGEEFTCCNDPDSCRESGCWCEELHLEKEKLEHLEQNYEDCLCRNCLTEFAKTALKNKII